jgi:hypothetical protein
LNNLEELKATIDQFIAEKKDIGRAKFIVQQGIRLLKYQGHAMDLRILIGKNGKGKWKAINFYGRYTKGNSTITNHSAGGDVALYEGMVPSLKKAYPQISLPKKSELGNLAIKAGMLIDKEFGLFGEIGMDIAIDEKGKLWIIEANARPDKYIGIKIDNPTGISPQAYSVFEYAKYLTMIRTKEKE